MSESTPPESSEHDWDAVSACRWAVLAIVMWVIYFALAYPPGGAPFVYAEF